MPDKEHLQLLIDAIAARDLSIWNRWRLENTATIPDLGGIDLAGADLAGAKLKDANLAEAHVEAGALKKSGNWLGSGISRLEKAALRVLKSNRATKNRTRGPGSKPPVEKPAGSSS